MVLKEKYLNLKDLKYIEKNACQALGVSLEKLGIGSSVWHEPDEFHKQSRCALLFENVGNIDPLFNNSKIDFVAFDNSYIDKIGISDANINTLQIDETNIGYLEFQDNNVIEDYYLSLDTKINKKNEK